MGQRSRSVNVGGTATVERGAHGVVLGAGMAGLLAARVLADHFEQVTVVDRDRLPDRPGFRRGVPQSRHLHVLLGRGLECLEQLFPGFEAELATAGAPVVEGSESLWLNAAGWCRRYRSPIRLLGASRELIEWQTRTRVTALDNVQLLEGLEAVSLLAGRGRDAVTGVRLRWRSGRAEATGPDTDVAADLVVDASGRGSHAPRWLAALGYQPPTQTSINSLLGYASRQYKIPAGFRADWRMLVINAKPPGNARSGALVPIEGGRWMVALIGAGRDYPPADDTGFLEFARGLRSPLLYETIKDAEPVSPIYSFRNTDNQRRHFERLRRWPEGFVVIGDASCSFNPIYAQGMTVTAMTAVALDHLLAEHRRRAGADPSGLARRLQRQVARTNAGAWTMATSEDLRYPWTEGARLDLPTRMMHRYADRVLEVANGNSKVNTAFVNVVNLRHPPTSLLRPRVLLPVLTRRRAPPLTGPPTTSKPDPAST
jgi:2-polyprenyl-6-methoxyphenol hydroxylase-like FAD-dependent oxidoreductase